MLSACILIIIWLLKSDIGPNLTNAHRSSDCPWFPFLFRQIKRQMVSSLFYLKRCIQCAYEVEDRFSSLYFRDTTLRKSHQAGMPPPYLLVVVIVKRKSKDVVNISVKVDFKFWWTGPRLPSASINWAEFNI